MRLLFESYARWAYRPRKWEASGTIFFPLSYARDFREASTEIDVKNSTVKPHSPATRGFPSSFDVISLIDKSTEHGTLSKIYWFELVGLKWSERLWILLSVCNIHSEQWNSGKMTIYFFIVWTVYVKYFPSQKTVDLYTVFLVATVAFSAIVY